jgi:DNA-binding protein HU-beta
LVYTDVTVWHTPINIKLVDLLAKAISLMNKATIVDKVHEALDGTKADAERAVDTVVDCIIDALKSGDEVSIAGLGIFSTKMRPARQGRNPRTGETIQISAMRVPKFRAAKALKDAVK